MVARQLSKHFPLLGLSLSSNASLFLAARNLAKINPTCLDMPRLADVNSVKLNVNTLV